jgi:hypothetical protein
MSSFESLFILSEAMMSYFVDTSTNRKILCNTIFDKHIAQNVVRFSLNECDGQVD